MAQYIDKSALVAEIERIKNETNYEPFTDEVLGKRCACRSLLSFLDTLKVKEVDLEKILIGFQNRYAYENSGELPSAIEIAKHFFELGLKAQRE